MNKFGVGMLVENIKIPAWGPGKVVHANGSYTFIIFRIRKNDVAKKFPVDSAAIALRRQQTDPVLDKLLPCVNKNGSWVVPEKCPTPEKKKAYKTSLKRYKQKMSRKKYAKRSALKKAKNQDTGRFMSENGGNFEPHFVQGGRPDSNRRRH